MNTQTRIRGQHLVEADTHFATGDGWWTRLFARQVGRTIDRIDQGLVAGSIEGHLPGGTVRLVGGHGAGPAAIIHIKSYRALIRLWVSGSVGFYRAWAAGEWSSPDPVQIFDLFMRNRVTLGDTARAHGVARLANRVVHALRRNSRAGAKRNIHAHYDLGNDFYAAWLDKTMTYSSALFADNMVGEPLDVAQERKVRKLLDRLALKPGDRLLEIGCGWGMLAEIAARDYGVHVTALTLSSEQKKWVDQRAIKAGLFDRISTALTDYRDIEGPFDAVASIEMVEAVGQAYWPVYLDMIVRVLKPGGRAAIQYISIADDVFDGYAQSADFIQTYIFPGGMLLSESRFSALAAERGLSWVDGQAFGLHYAETLRRWRTAFDGAVDQGRLPAGFDQRFVDLWRFYLMYCEGGFRGGGIDVAQVTLVRS
jgi:cyclopropane-fatty-acyl-phospholipid synthase